MKRVLLLGSTGKVGIALKNVFLNHYDIVEKNTSNLDASDFESVRAAVEEAAPDIIFNTIAYQGIKQCAEDPHHALTMNTLLPKHLAILANQYGSLLIHFSTECVFDDSAGGFLTEDDIPNPLNTYGVTKFGGDAMVQALAEKYYICRLPILFGPVVKPRQFVEKMLERVQQGEKKLRIAADEISSPTYSMDIALRVQELVDGEYPFGLYHVANSGKGSLYDLMCELKDQLKLDVEIEAASYRDFATVEPKHIHTPLLSKKLPPMRHWREAFKEYCGEFLCSTYMKMG